MKYYPTPFGSFPSVTSILSATQSTKRKAALQKWSEKPENQGSSSIARERGIKTHKLSEDFLLTGTAGIDDDENVNQLFQPLIPSLKLFSNVIWAEKPVDRKKYPDCVFWDEVEQSERGMVWSATGQYAGCPDFVGDFGGKLTLGDLKTSKRLYRRTAPAKPSPQVFNAAKYDSDPNHLLAAEAVKDYREKLNGYLAYQSCCVQLAGYKRALEETLAITIEQVMVIVATLRRAQVYILFDYEVQEAEKIWSKKLETFYTETLLNEGCK
jgi:hypothetical protein